MAAVQRSSIQAPALDRDARRFLNMLAAGGTGASPDAQERRAAFKRLAAAVDVSDEPIGAIENVSLPGPGGDIALRVYTPAGAASGPLPGIVYFHGGGWVIGDFDTHDGFCRMLANASGCRLIAVDYRLAPEHTFPAAMDDGWAATNWIAAHADAFGIDGDRLAIAGDSAGAAIAAATAQRARRAGGPGLALQVLICPVLDFAAETKSRRDFATGYFLDRATMNRDLELCCAPGQDPADPAMSPLRAADLAGLPPAVIHTAECDPVRDEGCAYARRLADAGVAVDYVCHAGVIHHFYGMGAVIAAARPAVAALGARVRSLLST